MNFEPLRAYMRRMLEKGVPGCELAVCRDHRVLFHACAGVSEAGKTRPAAPTDRYFLYSGTKPVTAAAAMRCMEQGLFGLDDPVERWLPEAKRAFLIRSGRREAPRNTMTIRHLMTMTAGFDYNLSAPPVRSLLERTGGQADTRQLAGALFESPLGFEPGTRYRYSLCLDVLGAVIEAASGMTLREYFRREILDPLGMNDTDFWTPGSDCPGLAAQYLYSAESGRLRLMPCENELIPSARFFSGGAGLVSTATDFLKFTDALACGESADGARILSRGSIDRMRSPQLAAFDAAGDFTCTCGTDYAYGLGVRTRVAFGGGAPGSVGEFGWDGAAGMDMMIDPAQRLSFVWFQHVRGWPELLGPVHLQIRDLLYPILGL